MMTIKLHIKSNVRLSSFSSDNRRVLQCFLLFLGRCAGTKNRRVFFQRNILHHLWPAVLGFFGYGRVRVTDDVPREDDVHAHHGGTRASRDPAGYERVGRSARGQVRLAAGAVVVVEADDNRTVMVASTHHRTIPIKVQVPSRPCFLYLCLDLGGKKK